ncbi:hypothetical protein ACQJBY_062963 [Aegilops geniculata]
MGEPPSTTSASVFLSTMTGAAISTRRCWRRRRRQPATAFLLQPGIPGLEPMPHAASRSSRRGDGRRAADDPFLLQPAIYLLEPASMFAAISPAICWNQRRPRRRRVFLLEPVYAFAGTTLFFCYNPSFVCYNRKWESPC